jgi:hypothetical protein
VFRDVTLRERERERDELRGERIDRMSQKFAYKATSSKSGLTILEEEVCGAWIRRTIQLMD